MSLRLRLAERNPLWRYALTHSLTCSIIIRLEVKSFRRESNSWATLLTAASLIWSEAVSGFHRSWFLVNCDTSFGGFCNFENQKTRVEINPLSAFADLDPSALAIASTALSSELRRCAFLASTFGRFAPFTSSK